MNCKHQRLTRRLHPDLLTWLAVVQCLDCPAWRPVKLKATYGPFRMPKNASVGAAAPPTSIEEHPIPAEPLPEEEPDGFISNEADDPASGQITQPMGSRRKESMPSPPQTPPVKVAKETRCPACTHKVYDADMFRSGEMFKEKMICKQCAIAFPQLIHPSEIERLATLRSSLGLTRVG